MKLASVLQSRLEIDVPINIHVTGCHHSCAQHYIGDIGLIACQVEQGDDMVDGYHVMIGGGWGDRQGLDDHSCNRSPLTKYQCGLSVWLVAIWNVVNPMNRVVDFARRCTDEQLTELTQISTVSN